MNRLLIPAVFAAMMTPAMGCTDWKAVAAFDAILVANDQKAVELSCPKGSNPADCAAHMLTNPSLSSVMQDRQNALDDKCLP